VREHLSQARALRVLDDLLGQVRRYEQHAGVSSQHDVAGHAGRRSDAAGHVHPDQGDVADRGGVYSAAEGVEPWDAEHLLRVPYAAINDLPRARAGSNRGREIGSRKGPLVYLAEQVDHDAVVLDQRLDDPGVHRADAALPVLPVGHEIVVQVGPVRHEHGRYGPPDDYPLRVHVEPTA